MNRWLLLLLLVAGHCFARDSTWPKLELTKADSRCQVIFDIAKQAYFSTSPDINQALVFTSDAARRTLTQHHIVNFDDEGIATTTYTDTKYPNTTYHWYKDNRGAYRVVEEVTAIGASDDYAYYLISPVQSYAQFKPVHTPEHNEVLSSGYIKAQVLYDESQYSHLFVTFGAPYNHLDEWSVFTFDGHQFNQRCAIQFHPKHKEVITALPKAVQTFDHLLNQSVGMDESGTYHPISQAKLNAVKVWANAAYRPWVTPGGGYNSRAQVDRNLLAWSALNTDNQRVYENLYQQMPLAERALADYYQTQFAMPQALAQTTAHNYVESALLTYYIFPAAS